MAPVTDKPLDFSIVRELRKRAGLTLSEVAERAGLSIPVVSKLERNQTRCELDTLYRIARVFGLTASDLLGLAEDCTAQAGTVRTYNSGPFTFEQLRFRGVTGFYGTAKAGESLSKPEAHGDEIEICWVRKGRIRIQLPREQHTLGAGEAVKFDAVLEHTYEILEDAELIIIHLTKTHRF
jgi:transcriptional regulator with XRE-family HTH domain